MKSPTFFLSEKIINARKKKPGMSLNMKLRLVYHPSQRNTLSIPTTIGFDKVETTQDFSGNVEVTAGLCHDGEIVPLFKIN